jgi:mannose-6-phosphate isomerase-like protein (cupin superfamily)
MSYTKDVGEVSAIQRLAGDVSGLTMRSGTTVRFVAPGSVTNQQFGLFEWNMGPRGGYITKGTVGLFDGSTWIDATPGDFLYVPEGGIHAFHNTSEEPASMLILFAPGPPREHYFEALAEIGQSGRKLSDEEWVELWARHDQYPAV